MTGTEFNWEDLTSEQQAEFLEGIVLACSALAVIYPSLGYVTREWVFGHGPKGKDALKPNHRLTLVETYLAASKKKGDFKPLIEFVQRMRPKARAKTDQGAGKAANQLPMAATAA